MLQILPNAESEIALTSVADSTELIVVKGTGRSDRLPGMAHHFAPE
jgi:hypothetical protein